eukprot:3936158-Amphidinium_carterae.3
MSQNGYEAPNAMSSPVVRRIALANIQVWFLQQSSACVVIAAVLLSEHVHADVGLVSLLQVKLCQVDRAGRSRRTTTQPEPYATYVQHGAPSGKEWLLY